MATNENLIPIPGRLHSVATEGHVAGADEIIDDNLSKDQQTINAEVNAALGEGGTVDEKIAEAIDDALENVAFIDDSESSPAVVPGFDPTTDTVHVTAQTLSESQKAQVRTNIGLGDVDAKINEAVASEASQRAAAVSGVQASVNAEASRAQAAETDRYTKSETYTKTEVNGLVDTPHQDYVTVDAYANLPATGSKDTIYRVSNYNGSTSQVDASVYSEYAWNGSQYVFLCVKSQIGEVFDISVYNNNAKYADLAAALNGGANIPQSLQKGGMSIKFVQSSDNKYVQYRYMESDATTAATFTNVANWQGVDDEPTAGSDNLVTSAGVFDFSSPVLPKQSFEKANVSGWTTYCYFKVLAGYKYSVKAKLSEAANGTKYFYVTDSPTAQSSAISFVISQGNTEGSVTFTNDTERTLYVRSYGTMSLVEGVIENLTISQLPVLDSEPIQNSKRPVESGGIYNTINNLKILQQQRLSAFYTLGEVIIDNVNQKFKCTANIATRIGETDYVIPANTEVSYSTYQSELTYSIPCLVFDMQNNTFKVVGWRNAANERIILTFGTVTSASNQITIHNVGFSSVPYSIVNAPTPSEYPNMYFGERVDWGDNYYKMAQYKSFGLGWNQSCVCYENYFLSFENANNTVRLYSLTDDSLLLTKGIPNGTYDMPHCNTACLGDTLHSANSIMPLVYVSQWTAGQQRACFVYDVTLTEGVYDVTLVQVINLASISSNLIGAGACDFAVFQNKLYAISYKVDSSYYADGANKTLINVFDLPSTADSEVVLTDNDVLVTKELPLIYMRQDLHVNGGNIYIAGGGVESAEQIAERKISVINALSLNITSVIPLVNFSGEPEGLTEHLGNLIITNTGGILYKLEFK